MTDTDKIISCPACGKEMHKIYLEDLDLYIDVCLDGCGGLFFDNRELKIINSSKENVEEILKHLENKTFEKTDETKDRICPTCGSKMVKNDISKEELREGQSVVIDECYSCGAKFLDLNELNSFKQFQAAKKDPDKENVNVEQIYSRLGIEEGKLDKDLKNLNPIQKFLLKLNK